MKHQRNLALICVVVAAFSAGCRGSEPENGTPRAESAGGHASQGRLPGAALSVVPQAASVD